MRKFTGLFLVSFIAIATAAPAHADIASTGYVDNKIGILPSGSTTVVAAINAAKADATYNDTALKNRVGSLETNAAVTSGITSTDVTQITTNKNDIASLKSGKQDANKKINEIRADGVASNDNYPSEKAVRDAIKTVNSAAEGAQSTANTAVANAATAQSAAEAAQSTADTAVANAATAQSAAEGAQSTADTAVANAATAQSAAEGAQSTADTALSTANGKQAKSTADYQMGKAGGGWTTMSADQKNALDSKITAAKVTALNELTVHGNIPAVCTGDNATAGCTLVYKGSAFEWEVIGR